MSLFNDTSAALAQASKLGVSKTIRGAVSGAVKGAGSRILGAAGLGDSKLGKMATTLVANKANGLATNLVNKVIPKNAQRLLGTGMGVASDLMNGNWEDAGLRLFDSGLLDQFLPGAMGLGAQMRYWGRPTPLFGGISPQEAKRIYDECQATKKARKNLFLVEVSSDLGGDIGEVFNMLVTDIEYAPCTITGEKINVGGAKIDSVTGQESVELRITTMDDMAGTLKAWYKAHHETAAHDDGTVSLPSEYLIKIKIVHAYITRESIRHWGGVSYEDVGLFRPANIEYSLSRREQAMQELQMTFSQFDTFMMP